MEKVIRTCDVLLSSFDLASYVLLRYSTSAPLHQIAAADHRYWSAKPMYGNVPKRNLDTNVRKNKICAMYIDSCCVNTYVLYEVSELFKLQIY